MRKTNYPHRHVNLIALHVFVVATVKLQIFDTNEPDFSPLEQGSNWGISLFVPVTHYNVSVTSGLAKNIQSTAMFC